MATDDATLILLAEAALKLPWGTPDQIDAENWFYDHLRERVTPEQFAKLEYDINTWRATTNEGIAMGLKLATTKEQSNDTVTTAAERI